MFEYTCQSCGAIGELEEDVDQVSCPQCGGIMMNNRGGASGNPGLFNGDDGEPTVAIPRDAAASPNRPRGPIKVAKAVDKGFGNMLARTTGPFAPYKKRDTQPKPPLASAPPIPTAQVVTHVAIPPQSPLPPPPPPSPLRKGPMAETTQGGSAKKFTMNKTRPTTSQTGIGRAAPSATPPAPSAQSPKATFQKTGMTFKKKGAPSPPPTPAAPPAPPPPPPPPPPPAPTPAQSPKATFQKTGMTFKKKGAPSAPPPKAAPPPTAAPMMGIPVAQPAPSTTPPTSADLHQAAQFAQLQQQFEAERRARIQAEQEAMTRRQAAEEAVRAEAIRREAEAMAQEQIRQAKLDAERRIAEERARAEKLAIEEAERSRRMAEEAARLAAQQATAELQARIDREREEAERLRREKEELERQRREAEEVRKKADAEFLRNTVSRAVEQSRIVMPTLSPALAPSPPPQAPSPPSPGAVPPSSPAPLDKPRPPESTKEAPAPLAPPSTPTVTVTPSASPDGIPELSLKAPAPAPTPEAKAPEAAKPGDAPATSGTPPIPELSLAKPETKDAPPEGPPATPSDAKPEEKPADDKKTDAAGKKKPLPGKYAPKKGGRPPVPPGRKPGVPPKAKAPAAKEPGSNGDKAKPAGNGDNKATKSLIDANGVMVTHTGLLRMKYRKRNVIYVIIGIAVLLCLIPIYFGVRWLKTGLSRSGRKPAPSTTTQTRTRTPAAAAQNNLVQQWSPYDDEFRAIKVKVKNLPWNSAVEIDAHIKIWQDFIDSHPDADPNDKCIKQAREQLKTMQDLRVMY